MEDKVRQYILREGLLRRTDRVLVTLSGGSDSVALLLVLLRLGYTCHAAHCNFHLRGAESDRDEEFVRRLCQRLGVCLHIRHFDTAGYAARQHVSIEMAARELRYAWFEDLRCSAGMDCIAVAHHEDDSVETILLNLMRGTGIDGLLGIRSRNGYIVRPLLCVGRQDIECYLGSMGQDWVTDSTNLQDDFARNKVRLDILPLMSSVNPAAKQNIMRTAMHLQGVAAIYNNGIAEGRAHVMRDGGISIEALLAEPSPETLLYEIVSPMGFNGSQAEDMMKAVRGSQPGKVFRSSTHTVVRDRNMLVIGTAEDGMLPQLSFTDVAVGSGFTIPRDSHTACFDTDKLHGEWYTRLWQHGDWFVPFGMKGRKLVSDFLTDQKLNVLQKQHQYVLCCGDDIVWVIGRRTDNRFRIDGNTRRATIVTCRRDQ